MTGQLAAAYVPNATTGAAGDYLHSNRAGYQAAANFSLPEVQSNPITGFRIPH